MKNVSRGNGKAKKDEKRWLTGEREREREAKLSFVLGGTLRRYITANRSI